MPRRRRPDLAGSRLSGASVCRLTSPAGAPPCRRQRSAWQLGATMAEGVNKVVLAYSGGLDTSVILRWLQEEYRCQVVTFTADLGQGEELEPARAKAEMMGASPIFVEDLRE